MAEMKIGFVTFNPGSGDGDQAVTVSGEKYEGRVQRTLQVEFGAESGDVKKSATINQAPVAEFVKNRSYCISRKRRWCCNDQRYK